MRNPHQAGGWSGDNGIRPAVWQQPRNDPVRSRPLQQRRSHQQQLVDFGSDSDDDEGREGQQEAVVTGGRYTVSQSNLGSCGSREMGPVQGPRGRKDASGKLEIGDLSLQLQRSLAPFTGDALQQLDDLHKRNTRQLHQQQQHQKQQQRELQQQREEDMLQPVNSGLAWHAQGIEIGDAGHDGLPLQQVWTRPDGIIFHEQGGEVRISVVSWLWSVV